MRLTVTALADKLQTEADAWKFLEDLRWPDGPTCPTCGGEDVYLIVPKNGVSRRTVSGSMSQRRTWNCRPCRRQFSATTGTMMHGTRLPIRLWVLVIFEMVASKNGVAACEIERKYGICARSVWFLMHRIREAMKTDTTVAPMVGTIVADETFIGGDPKRMNTQRRKMWEFGRDGKNTDKTPVLSLVDTGTGEVRSRVVTDVRGVTLRKVIADQVAMAHSTLHTDEGRQYLPVGQEFTAHHTVNHSEDQYVDYSTGATTNQVENFFGQLKRSLDGTYHHVSREHLNRYLSEFDFRYSTRKVSDAERMGRLVGQAEGRRLSYKRVTA